MVHLAARHRDVLQTGNSTPRPARLGGGNDWTEMMILNKVITLGSGCVENTSTLERAKVWQQLLEGSIK